MEVSKCEIHGTDNASCSFSGDPIFYCKECAAEQDLEADKERELLRRKKSFDRRLHNAMISPRFTEKTLDNYSAETEGQKKALSLAKWFIENHKTVTGMIFIGKTGTGKNHLACGIIHEIVNQGGTALITTAMKVIRSIKDSWRDHISKEGEIIELYTKPGLLVIDEIGVQFGSDTE